MKFARLRLINKETGKETNQKDYISLDSKEYKILLSSDSPYEVEVLVGSIKYARSYELLLERLGRIEVQHSSKQARIERYQEDRNRRTKENLK